MTLWLWLRAVYVWCVWTSPAAFRPATPTGLWWCCMVVAGNEMAQTAGMINQCRWDFNTVISLFLQRYNLGNYLLHLLSVCCRNGWGVWGGVWAFPVWGNSHGGVLRVPYETHVSQHPTATTMPVNASDTGRVLLLWSEQGVRSERFSRPAPEHSPLQGGYCGNATPTFRLS